jgi:hypothetical protein
MSSFSLTGAVGATTSFDRDRDDVATANSTDPQTPVLAPRLGSVAIRRKTSAASARTLRETLRR